jgi:hypothetical protein
MTSSVPVRGVIVRCEHPLDSVFGSRQRDGITKPFGYAPAVSLTRRVSLLMLAFAPFILVMARGRRLSPALPGTAVRTAAVGIVSGAIWLVILLCFAFHPGLLPPLLLGVLPLLTSATQAVFAAAHLARREGRARGQMASAWFGALIGHYVWSMLVLLVIAASTAGNELLMSALLIIPAAFLGAAGAALGAVLVTPLSK